MRTIICLTAALALVGCNKASEAPPADNTATDIPNTAAPAATPAATSINESSWEYTDSKTGKPIQESIDAAGKYISQSGTEHMDHGTVVMKNGKACFTSAMTKEGEVCWTDPMVEAGQSGETTSDKGEKLAIKRVPYTPLKM